MINSEDFIETYFEKIDPDGNVRREYLRGRRGPWNLKEALAQYAHDAWSGWMRYMFEKSQKNEDGSVTIPAELVERWRRQMMTEYTALPESEKVSDRTEAKRMMRIFVQNLDEGDD